METNNFKASKCNGQIGFLVKVSQIRNDFFKPTFLPKERTNKFDFTTCRLVFVRFLEEGVDTKKTFRN